MKFQLREDQISDLAYFMANPKALFLSEPGTGKTPVVCVLQRWLWTEHQIGTVWTMPSKLMVKNKEEAMLFGQWPSSDDVVIVESEKDLEKPAKVFIMTFARFRMSWEKLPSYVTALHIDEHHKGFGGVNSGQTNAMNQFMWTRGTHYLPMTGTLYNGKPDTCYSALSIIEPRYYGNYDGFKNFHHVIDLWTGKVTDYRNLDHLQKLLTKHGRRRLWRDIHGDVNIVLHKEIVDMEPEQQRLYDTLKDEAILELERFFVDGTLPGVAFIRCRQILEHPNYFPDLTMPGTTVDIIPERRPGKLELLDLHFENHAANKQPLVVFASLIPQQRQILELSREHGLRFEILNGEVSHAESSQISKAFETGALDGLVCSPLVADAGFNWQFSGGKEVSHAIYASLDFRDTSFVQSYGRFLRGKRESALRLTILKYRNSLDDRIAYLVNKKSRDAQKVDPSRTILEL